MSDISQIQLPDSNSYNLKDSYTRDKLIYPVKGTHSSATNAWTGTIDAPSLYDGMTIAYYLPYAGNGSTDTLNLTLSTGTTTGAVNCYYGGNTRLTTHYGAGSVIIMTYYSAGSISVSGTATTDNRWTRCEYDANTIGIYNGNVIAGANGIYAYSLIMKTSPDRWESIVLSSSTATTKVANASGFLISDGIEMFYPQQSKAVGENTTSSSYIIMGSYYDFRYSANVNDSWSVNGRPLFLVGTVSGNRFYLDPTTWWTDTIPTTATDKYYIYVGQMCSAYQYTIHPHHPIYHSYEDSIRGVVFDEYKPSEYETVSVIEDVTLPNASISGTTLKFTTGSKTTTNALVIPSSKPIVYGFKITASNNLTDPYKTVSYIEDCTGFTPAKMNYTTNTFDWGSWKDDVFFMPKPCMLKYDGTVDYYLDPSDYSKKLDGTASDIANDSYEGNAMMEWGRDGKKIWYKIVPDSTDPTNASIYISDRQVDEGYHAYSFVKYDGTYSDHFYTSIYNGTLVTTNSVQRLRSLSGKTYSNYCKSKTASQEIGFAEANNISGNKHWYIDQWCDTVLINFLLILIGKSLNTQTVFGRGNDSQSSAEANMLDTGTMNDKGLFWGDNTTNKTGVKVFGMENWWANQWRRTAGLIVSAYTIKYKMTRSTFDGSSATDYNTDGTNYLTAGFTACNTNGYAKFMTYNDKFGFTTSVGAGSTTYYSDYYYQTADTNRYLLRGGHCYGGVNGGTFCLYVAHASSATAWTIGACLSCKS